MPATDRKLRLAYAALALLFVISLTYRLRDTVDRFDEVRHGDVLARIPFDIDLPQLAISDTQPESERAGLRTGDVIVSVSGRPLRGIVDLWVPLRNARAGERLILQVESPAPTGAGSRTATIDLQSMRPGPPTAYDWLYFAVVSLATPCLCMALGFWVAAVRIRDPRAWLLLALLLSLAEWATADGRTLFGREDLFQQIVIVYQPLVANLWPATMMLFGIYFPERLGFDKRFPWAKWMVIAPLLFGVAVTTVTLELVLHNAAAATEFGRLFGWTEGLVQLLDLAAMAVFFAALGYKTITASSPDARRRLLLLDLGAAVSVIPIFSFIVLVTLEIVELRDWLLLPILGALLVFPLTMAYVIVVQRAMDVRVVVRQGIQYLLARGSLRAVQVALSVLVVAAAAATGATSSLTRLALIAAGLGGVLLIQTSSDRLRLWVDRRFFREAYDAERILSDLANKVRTMVETGPLLETVAQRVSETLHVPRVAVLLNGGSTLRPVFALGYPQLATLAIGQDGLTEDVERTLRETLESELLLPLTSNQKLIGVMSLGPKQSEEPFSSSDVRLLNAVATHTGLALENSRLTAEIAAEVAQREKAKRELEIAHEVQERLFPQEYPPVAGLDYAGACRPALGVGGDYYDFIRISEDELGIAIGDVSGKGIPAALLMATLRAYLRAQTIRGESDLAAMMANLNELVYESSAANRYATFFYGQYDAGTRVLHYVNGGHNPPMIFRRAVCDVLRLEAGGPVIGLMQGCRYEQGCAILEPGDVLVAFTDGVSEAMNGADEEWGETQLIDAVRPNPTLQARELIQRIMQDADVFVAGAPQHDDMTLVVIRLV